MPYESTFLDSMRATIKEMIDEKHSVCRQDKKGYRMPDRIEYSEALGAEVRRLIDVSRAIELEIDEEQYANVPEESRPKVTAALAVKAAEWTSWATQGTNIILSVCGSKKHPIAASWLLWVVERENVVDAVRRGRGVLEGFLSCWMLGTLWKLPAEEEGEG